MERLKLTIEIPPSFPRLSPLDQTAVELDSWGVRSNVRLHNLDDRLDITASFTIHSAVFLTYLPRYPLKLERSKRRKIIKTEEPPTRTNALRHWLALCPVLLDNDMASCGYYDVQNSWMPGASPTSINASTSGRCRHSCKRTWAWSPKEKTSFAGRRKNLFIIYELNVYDRRFNVFRTPFAYLFTPSQSRAHEEADQSKLRVYIPITVLIDNMCCRDRIAQWRYSYTVYRLGSILGLSGRYPHYISNSMGVLSRLPGYAGVVGTGLLKNVRPWRGRGAEGGRASSRFIGFMSFGI
ncbi:uncharacterized protein BO96DRAFT_436312 [Aspergillus niger CBS 101883]|uniref:uncharacterized protein n=1 Tax=Aspergillus lacticoffeatus (strain CBS 101883) TaxID=1450533 RepID=UPI000D7EF986|nr:uncharacterized protein BO96DRAFT_436312 [Aspergillus niger CBS 101883]PYH54261.1 hypothetical protein BO96DRAFT_436312 [Aspergillus niger CBS 101883]